jgi:AcrR family transcriptional regulator
VSSQESVIESTEDAARPMRADAKRNYDKLVEAARKVFGTEGGGASMESIAKVAGVGIGTLYRHFPKRIDVVEAVYRDDVDQLLATAERAAAELEPWPAVETFLRAFVRYAHGKRVFLTELHEAFTQNPDLKSRSRERIDYATELVIGRAQRVGAVRTDVSGADVMALLGPMCTAATLTEEQSNRLMNMILDGLRVQADGGLTGATLSAP